MKFSSAFLLAFVVIGIIYYGVGLPGITATLGYWLTHEIGSSGVQALSAVVTVILTGVLVSVTSRYTMLMKASVRITQQQMLISIFPSLRLEVRSQSGNARDIEVSVYNPGDQDVRLLAASVVWKLPESAITSPSFVPFASSPKDSGYRQKIDGPFLQLIPPKESTFYRFELPSDKVTAAYMNLTNQEADKYLTFKVVCTNMAGVGLYHYSYNVVSGYASKAEMNGQVPELVSWERWE